MKKIRLGPLVFKIALLPAVVFICLLPLLMALGFWQLRRADEKQAMLVLQEQRLRSDPVQLRGGINPNLAALRYRQATATGRLDGAHQFLVDNQIVNGRAGYFVLTPLIIEGTASAVLINRGWMPANSNRTSLPDVTITAQDAPITINGRINAFPSVGIRLAEAEIPAAGWPALVQVVDSEELAKRLGYPVFDFQLEMNADQAGGFLREWKTAALMPPAKHIAYAFQWFGLAAALIILFLWLSCKHNEGQ